VLAGLFMVSLVFFYQYVQGLDMLPGFYLDALLALVPWAGFLILTGYVVGKLAEAREAQLNDVKNAYLATLELLTYHIESTERHQQGHSNRVADVAVAMARELKLPRPLRAWEQHQTKSEVVQLIDALLDEHHDGEVADILNRNGHTSGRGLPFSARLVAQVRRSHGLKNRHERLRAEGFLTKVELADKLSISPATVTTWRVHGLLRAHAYTGKPDYLYEDPGPNPPAKAQGRKLTLRAAEMNLDPERTKEVQCEA